MKRAIPIFLALLLPAAIFAQGRAAPDENGLLKGFGLTDAQITQVTTIEKSTKDAVQADMTHIRLVQAQIAEALLPAAPDQTAINALIDKKGQLRTDIEKTVLAARLQLVKIMGSDNYKKYAKSVIAERHPGWKRMGQTGRMGYLGAGGMMGQPADAAAAR